MKRMIFFVSLLTFLLISACENDQDANQNTGAVELYLLTAYKTIDNTFQIDESTVVSDEHPLINYSELNSYDPDNYIFTISNNTKKKIESLEHSTHGLAFGIKASGVLIYTGYFWPGYSSMSCNWITTDPLMLDFNNGIKMELGYEVQGQGITIPDKRNDTRIIDIFKSDNKLIE